MRRRPRASGKPVKTRPDKTVSSKHRKAPKAMRRGASSAATQKVARLTRELHEALGQQAATSEVLRVISSSQGELQPVFESMLTNATRLCGAELGILTLVEGDAFRIVAWHGMAHLYAREPVIRPGPLAPISRAAAAKDFVHIIDLAQDASYQQRDPPVVALVEKGGVRSLLLVPMLKEGQVVGTLSVYRREVQAFTDKQIALLQNFAAQAVIAIENARLLAELRQRTDDLSRRTADLTEALEQQTATAEVLKVISSSPGKLEPVFTTILEKAIRICNAKLGGLYLYQNGRLRTVAAARRAGVFCGTSKCSLGPSTGRCD